MKTLTSARPENSENSGFVSLSWVSWANCGVDGFKIIEGVLNKMNRGLKKVQCPFNKVEADTGDSIRARYPTPRAAGTAF